ncbi:hypothetical protein DB346_02505 [Verrucomicrobia bacterium LW23]|nr:hypothetical protein DB346_04150 [Verrucomicrobia bacterium LW23]PTY04320.1 hypothetical protein DB346_02505 [Verrucomicrobia bacterium LW23]
MAPPSPPLPALPPPRLSHLAPGAVAEKTDGYTYPLFPGANPGYQVLRRAWYRNFSYWDAISRTWASAPPEVEWSDRIHPAVVLEVQRGLRSYNLVYTILGIQLAMAAALAWDVSRHYSFASELHAILDDGSSLMENFWSIAATYLLCMPWAGVFALDRDRRSGALELLCFTPMGPPSIVVGKWMAFTLQAMLITTTLLPHVVLLYFINGANPLTSCIQLAGLVWISSCISATAISASARRSLETRLFGLPSGVIVRFGLTLLLIQFAFGCLHFLTGSRLFNLGMGGGSPQHWGLVLLVGAAISFHTVIALSLQHGCEALAERHHYLHKVDEPGGPDRHPAGATSQATTPAQP